jgi:ABC-type dipeptide/oligopeptide/nickel transport system permease component
VLPLFGVGSGFWLGLNLSAVLGLGLFPVAGYVPRVGRRAALAGAPADAGMAHPPIARMTRSSMLEVLGQTVHTARAKAIVSPA